MSQRCNVSTIGDFMTKKKIKLWLFFFNHLFYLFYCILYFFCLACLLLHLAPPVWPRPKQRLRVRTKDKCGNKELLFEAVTLSAAASVNSINPPNHTHSYAQTPRIGATCTSVSTSFFSFFSKSIENDIKQFRSCLHYRNHTTVPQLYWRPWFICWRTMYLVCKLYSESSHIIQKSSPNTVIFTHLRLWWNIGVTVFFYHAILFQPNSLCAFPLCAQCSLLKKQRKKILNTLKIQSRNNPFLFRLLLLKLQFKDI